MYKEFLDDFYKQFPDRKVMFLIKAGSHFFDLNTENSDTDYRGIYMPTPQEFYEGESRRAMYERKTQLNKKGIKNTKEDVDFTLYSVTKFLKLLKSGDFNMMEMLHAPQSKILINSEYIKYLSSIRKNLLVNDISAFLGFIKKEYKRYGINIYHYKVQEDFFNFLQKYPYHTRLNQIWKEIEEYAKDNNHIIFTTSSTGNHNYVKSLKIAQRLYQNTVTVEYIRQALSNNLTRYGHRQKNMAADGVEFKGLYHALRLIYEANDLYDYGEFKIPFDEDRRKLLLDIKSGNLAQQELFDLIDKELESLYAREKTCIYNKDVVKYRIDKLLFQLEGCKKIEYIKKG